MTASAARSTAARDDGAFRVDELLAGLGHRAPQFSVVPAKVVPVERVAPVLEDEGMVLSNAEGDALVAFGEAISVPASSESFGETASSVLESLRSLARRGSVVAPFATFALTFDAARTREEGHPRGAFVVPQLAYVVRRGRAYVTAVGTSADEGRIRSLARRLSAALVETGAHSNQAASVASIEVADDERFRASVESAVTAIANGELDKVVLARRVVAKLTAPIDLASMLCALGRRSPNAHRFALVREGTTFVGATPERLVSCRDRCIVTEALAGTKKRGEAEALVSSEKDRAEQRWVRDEIERVLEPYVESLVIDREPRTREVRDVVHLATGFEGRLRTGATVLDVLGALHPTPAVCGVPREVARRFIREAEPFDRGFYAAPFGWVDANGDADAVVALRCGSFRGVDAAFFAGAGIVARSVPALELEETDLKLRTILGALDGESE